MKRDELRTLLAEKCAVCRSGEMPYLWRCPAGVEGWTEGWHHAESEDGGWDDADRCAASDLIDLHDPTGAILGGQREETACTCPCHEDGATAFGEEPGACHLCEDSGYQYADRIGLTGDRCVIGQLLWEADTTRARVRAAEVEPLVALLRRVARKDASERYPEECEQCDWRIKPCPACQLTLDIRAALKGHEEGR